MFKYLLRDKKRFFLVILLNSIGTVLLTGLALVYGTIVDKVSLGVTTNEFLTMLGLALLYSVFTACVFWFKSVYASRFNTKTFFAVMEDLFSRTMFGKYEDIIKEESSTHLDRIMNDTSTVFWGAWSVVVITDSVVGIVTAFVAAIVLSPQVALVMAGMTLFMAIIPLFIKKPLDRIHQKDSEIRKTVIQALQEKLSGISIIKSFSAEKEEISAFHKNVNERRKTNIKKGFIDGTSAGLAMVVQNIAMLTLIGFTSWLVISGDVLIGAVLAIVQIGMSFYGGIQKVAMDITGYLGQKSVRKTVLAALNKPIDERIAKGGAFNDKIELSGVSFKYPGTERLVIDNLNLTFEKNKKYLVLGKSGSGKSTVLKLIAKFYKDYDGMISLDGTDYQELTDQDVTKIVSIAEQKCFLFKKTFRENIDFLADGDANKLIEIIAFTCLDGFVKLLPDGLDTIISEEVNQVSGGEKLRINLARALYRVSDVLLLDEVTSALDKETSHKVENNLLSVENKMIVNVCHKFNDETLSKYDKTIIMEDGKVIAQGSYQSLKDGEILQRYRDIE